MSQASANLNILIKAARRASRGLLRDFGEVENLQVSSKAAGDFVSKADIKAEEIIFEELNEAMKNKDLLEVADALTDILYVTYGAGHAFGIDLDKCFNEVQNSNMSKLDSNGKPIYNFDGKVMKGPNYFKPDLKKFVN